MVHEDTLDYYFFKYDFLLQPQKTKFFLAFDDESVVGLALIYNDSMVQLRGEPAVVAFMLGELKLQHADVQVPLACKEILLERYPAALLQEKITLMSLEKADARLDIKVKPEVLHASDTGDIALIMNESYPKMWRDMTKEQVSGFFASSCSYWLGIREQGKLVSFGYATLTPQVSHVTWLATKPQYQKKGYGLSIVSALIKKCLTNGPTAVIYVMGDNEIAKQLYAKVGFKPYKHYFFIKT